MRVDDGARAPRSPRLGAVVAPLCGVLSAGIGVSALIGWIAGIDALHRISATFIPTAPSTALALVLLGTAVFALDRWPERRAARTYVDAAAVVVCVLSALLIAQFVGGFDLGLESAVVATPQTFAGVRVGRMSPVVAGGFLLAALSLIALTTYPSETAAGRRVAVGMGFGTFAIGGEGLLGYALGAPLFYDSGVIPVALPAASGLSLLGAGIVAAAIRAPGPGGGADARRRTRSSVMRYVPAAFGVGATALLTVVAASIARQLDQTRLQEAFEAQARIAAGSLQEAIDQGLTGVRSVAAAIGMDAAVTRQEFRQLAAASRPISGGVIDVAWVPRVLIDTRARFVAAARRDGRSDFRVTERGPAGRLVDAGRRNESFPVLYLEPSEGLEPLLGFDVGTEPAAADALRRARDANAAAVSDGFTLVTDPPGRITVVTVQPVPDTRPPRAAPQRAGGRGYALGVVRFAEVVRAVDPGLESQGIAVTLRDIRQGALVPLYGGPVAAPAHLSVAHAETLAVGDRRWQAEFVPTEAYASLHPRWSAWALLAAGLLFALLIGAHLLGMERYASDLETARAELQDALANVKTLSGLMPICAWCKKIRDDKGYWTQLESYLSEHTTAEFSHGMCPDCERKYRDGDVS